MTKPIRKYLSSLLIISWILSFQFVEPTHHHEDNHSHSDCPICLIALQQGIASLHFSVPTPVYKQFVNLSFTQSQHSSSEPLQNKSRSPPLI